MRRTLAVCLLLAGRVEAAAPETGWAVLPVDEYRALRQKAAPLAATPPPPPVDMTISRVDYDLRVEGDAAVGTARLTIDVLREGWVRVPVPGELRVSAATIEGRPVTLVRTANAAQPPVVPLSWPGRSVLSLEIAVPIPSAEGRESMALPGGGGAVTRAALSIPRQGVEITVAGAVLAETGAGGEQTRAVAYGDGSGALVFSWRRKVEDLRGTLPLRLRGHLVQHAGFGEETVHLAADVRIEVVQGAAGAVALRLPDGFSVERVAGRNVADWHVRSGRLEITFLDPVTTAETFVVHAEARGAREGRLAVPLLRLDAAERETGGVAVEVLGAGEIKQSEARGLDATDAADLGDGVAGRSWGLAEAFRFRPQDGAAPRSLAVTLSRYTPQAVLMAAIEEARYEVLLNDDGRTLVRGRFAVRNNTQSFLTAALPPSATLWSAAVAGRPVRPGRSAQGTFLLPLEKSRTGEEAPAFVVELVYLASGAAWEREGSVSLRLPAVDLPVARIGVALRHSPRRKLRFEPGAFREQSYDPPLAPAFRAGNTPGLPAAPMVDAAVAGFLERARTLGGAARAGGIRPIQVDFPAYGSLTFLTSELNEAGRAPTLDIRYKTTKGGRS